MANRLKIGAAEIAFAEDASWTMRPLTMFPKVPQEQWRQEVPETTDEGTVHSRVVSFVVRSQGKTILVDSGVGEWGLMPAFGEGHLLESLKALDVSPQDVDFVLPTHLHADHVGWNTRSSENGPVPTFTRARYLFQQRDWDHFTSAAYLESSTGAGPAMMRNCVIPLQNTGLMDLIGSEAKITDEVTLLHSPGHTPGQCAVLVQSQGEAAIMLGDIAHHPAQLTEPEWTASIDIDQDLSARSRRAVVDLAKKLNGMVAAAHFNAPGSPVFGHILEIEGRNYWRGVDLP